MAAYHRGASSASAFIAKALGDIARAEGIPQVARESGLSMESLYKALSGERSPSFDTILKVVSALGLKLSASVRSEAEVT
ncbi:MAG: addiction module antidote protein [Synechococcus sp.]